MRKVLGVIVNFIIAYITYKVFVYVPNYKFFVAWIGGAICMLVYCSISGEMKDDDY